MEWLDVVTGILSVIGGSAVAASLPFAKYLGPLVKILDIIGANVGRAKNKE